MTEIHPHIDLEKAVQKIAGRQSLNDVHFLIQLVRKAMQGLPQSISINYSRNQWQFSHDGIGPEHEELLTLCKLLNQKASLIDLEHMEQKFGLGLLSVIVGSRTAQLNCRHGTLRLNQGRCQVGPSQNPIEGFSLVFEPTQTTTSDPIPELSLHCSRAKTDISYNGKPIPRNTSLPDMLLHTTWQTDLGEGLLGITLQSLDNRIFFHKQGVLFGVRHQLGEIKNGIFGYWNSKLGHVEPDFEESIHVGLKELKEKCEHLFTAVPQHLSKLSPTQKHRLKNLLLQRPYSTWNKSLVKLPLFQWSRHPFSLSMEQIHDRVIQELGLRYRHSSQKSTAPCACLTPQDIHFLTSQAGIPLRMIDR